jgi:hypothetical protein
MCRWKIYNRRCHHSALDNRPRTNKFQAPSASALILSTEE